MRVSCRELGLESKRVGDCSHFSLGHEPLASQQYELAHCHIEPTGLHFTIYQGVFPWMS